MQGGDNDAAIVRAAVDRARAGDGTAFDVLYARFARSVARVVAERLADPDDRADAVQETFVRAWRKLDTLRDLDQFPAWLYAIARNAATSIGRGRTRTRADTIEEDALPPAPDASPSDIAEASALRAAATEAGSLLSHRDATVLALVVNLGFGPGEVAQALGVTETNAAVIVHRARGRLRRSLEARGMVEVA